MIGSHEILLLIQCSLTDKLDYLCYASHLKNIDYFDNVLTFEGKTLCLFIFE